MEKRFIKYNQYEVKHYFDGFNWKFSLWINDYFVENIYFSYRYLQHNIIVVTDIILPNGLLNRLVEKYNKFNFNI